MTPSKTPLLDAYIAASEAQYAREQRRRVMQLRWRIPAFALAAAVFIWLVSGAEAQEPDLSSEQVYALIVERALARGVDPQLLLDTAFCESRFRPSARGAQGERGVMQWLPGTGNAWDQTSAHAHGIDIQRLYAEKHPEAPYWDADMAAELFARGEAYRRQHWASTYRRRCQ